MAFTLDQVVPWGRPFSEYVRMFALSEADLQRRIVGVGDGPASFNAELTARGGTAVSCDPLYQFSADQIRQRIDEITPIMVRETEANKEEFVWDHFGNPAGLIAARQGAMARFLEDYDSGKENGRYLNASLPNLPFNAGEFDLAVCSHFLFLYSQQFSYDFHLEAAQELLRVANEVRIFPLLQLGSTPSPYVGRVVETLTAVGHQVMIKTVNYEFQKGGNQMLRVKNARSNNAHHYTETVE